MKLTVPNLLTLFRLASAPIFLALFIGSGKEGFFSSFLTPWQGLLACLIVASLSEISDILDGILARRWNQVSDFGKILDPYADSTFRLSCYFAFASQAHGRWIPLWMVMILFYRDLLVTVIRAFGIERREFVSARASGKIKAIAQGTVVISLLVLALWHGDDGGRLVDESGVAKSVMWVVTAVTAWSAWDYFWGNKHLFRKKDKSAESPPIQSPNPPPA
jgi:CDP-diacylglycerol---glycerol-3-phosphate 3-phosphatidyltransferase